MHVSNNIVTHSDMRLVNSTFNFTIEIHCTVNYLVASPSYGN